MTLEHWRGQNHHETYNGEAPDKKDENRQKFQHLAQCGDELKIDESFTTSEQIEEPLEAVTNLSKAEAIGILNNALQYHQGDPNFPEEDRTRISNLLNDKDTEKGVEESLKREANIIHFHSPYPDVRGVTDPVDDPAIPAETTRAYILGMILVILGTGVNQFFEPRMPHIKVHSHLLQVLLLPIARVFEKLPRWQFKVMGKQVTINPGPWTYKEQTFVTIIFGITQNLAYVNDQVYVQRMKFWYNNKWANAGYQILLVLSTQFIGFGLAGLARHIFVYPVERMWPTCLSTLALNKALMGGDRKESINGWKITRYQMFLISFFGMFLYFWIPDYLFKALSTFNWMTWIAPENFNLAAITGSVTGLGINPIPTFDWNVIFVLTHPMMTPFYANFNWWIGGLIAGCAVIPAVYWSNMYNTAYLPINSNKLYTNKAQIYDVKKVLANGVLDDEKYQSYSPPYYTAANLVVYGAYFAMYPAMIVELVLKDWEVVSKGFQCLFQSLLGRIDIKMTHNDAHSRMMQVYPEVPHWWYIVILLVSIALGIVCVEIYPTEAPVWGIFFALAISLLFLVPTGLLYSSCNALFKLEVIAELVGGYALEGKGVALMIFKAFCVNTNVQTIYFARDQKVGHYAKIPPRATFRGQVIGAVIQSFVALGVANWQISNYKGICEPDQPANFTCPSQNTYFSSSVVWGVIGPRRVFDQLYPALKYTFLIGAFIPVIFLIAEKLVPKKLIPAKMWYKTSPLLMLYGIVMFYAPYNLTYSTGGVYIGWFFMHYVRRRYTRWFEKYNYVLTSALSAGIAFSAVIIFFSVQYHPKPLSWWGNNVSKAGEDGAGNPLLPLPKEGYFGLAPGNYPI